ncbi:MAG TPA: hypothetical protein DCS19_07915 [Flavobacterium sp.]|nr:hypothetical protein [Flavobacterium sp.]
MENLITPAYFHGLIELPDSQVSAELNTPSGEAVAYQNDKLMVNIAKYQKKLLVKLFGSEVVPDEVASLLVDETTLTSPIANYVFCNVIKDYQSTSTMQGEQIQSAENTIHISYKNKQDEAWNDMVEMLGEIREVLYNAGKDFDYPTDYYSEIYKLSYFL